MNTLAYFVLFYAGGVTGVLLANGVTSATLKLAFTWPVVAAVRLYRAFRGRKA